MIGQGGSANLEVRLEALEAEVKVLKSEIQNILLEIQEQVLLHYYPSLRVEDEEPSDMVIQALETVRKKRQEAEEAETAEEAMFPDVAGPFPHNGGASVSEPDALNVDRVGRWSQEGGGTHLPPALIPPPGGAPVSSRADAAHGSGEWETFSETVTWVQESISKIGKDRTVQLIRLYAAQGLLSSSVADGLMRVMALFA